MLLELTRVFVVCFTCICFRGQIEICAVSIHQTVVSTLWFSPFQDSPSLPSNCDGPELCLLVPEASKTRFLLFPHDTQ